MPSDKFNCLECGEGLALHSQDFHTAKKYDYTLATRTYYYKCAACGKMFDEVIKSTGLRHLSMANYEKAEKLANN